MDIKTLVEEGNYEALENIWLMSESQRDEVLKTPSEKIGNEIILNPDSKHTTTLEKREDGSFEYIERSIDTKPEDYFRKIVEIKYE